MRAALPHLLRLAAATASLASGVARADAARDFESRVRPLLVAKCQECHGEKVAEAGLRLDSRRALLQGSDTGPVVVPGALAPVMCDAEHGTATYVEPNVWIRHPTGV